MLVKSARMFSGRRLAPAATIKPVKTVDFQGVFQVGWMLEKKL
jgi:hypothetical protein